MSSEVTRRDEWQTAVWVNALVHTCFTHSETEKNGLTWAESKSSTLTFTASRVCVCVWPDNCPWRVVVQTVAWDHTQTDTHTHIHTLTWLNPLNWDYSSQCTEIWRNQWCWTSPFKFTHTLGFHVL